jgi:hypothetical protein
LDHCLFFVPEQILDEVHFLPVRAMFLKADRDVLPAKSISADCAKDAAARPEDMEYAVMTCRGIGGAYPGFWTSFCAIRRRGDFAVRL